MDFSIFYKLKFSKSWWVDVVFYSAASLFLAVIFCYFVFLLKIYMQNQEIKDYQAKMETVVTPQQKEQEKVVFNYRKKISDYSKLILKHQISSNALSYLEKNTLPDVWFYKFSLGTGENKIDMSGECENLNSLSRQTSIFEKDEFIKKVDVLSSSLGDLGKVEFNMSLTVDPKIFNYGNK